MSTQSRLLRRLQAAEETPPAAWVDEKTLRYAIHALQVPDSQVRLQAIRTLIRAGEVAVPALIQALNSEQEDVWRLAAAALFKIGDPAVPYLVEALEHPDKAVRMLAVGVLQKLGRPARNEPGWYLMRQAYRQLPNYQKAAQH
jgi:HEAT repeat protein